MMGDGKRAVVRRVVRESIAIAYVVAVLFAWSLSVTRPDIVSPTGVQQAALDTFFFLFAVAGGYLVFGKRALDAAVDSYQKLTMSTEKRNARIAAGDDTSGD
ncbi:hypothetical protein [Haloplanus aerogenes]|uniref:Uncharacterized protein n=1 Tax=Haloplanus aerogenes TaxID=660522 RepID=A0A3M0D9P0_9EURY|nr:hypothetical protein [Haloplanus aerogenes]AZH26381.1 hypothetical protein DU502_13850 [Haloplanus aerogenes]RMB18154.1 hypothetical protein ATH50_1604 [Haloplanus aerogenes]